MTQNLNTKFRLAELEFFAIFFRPDVKLGEMKFLSVFIT